MPVSLIPAHVLETPKRLVRELPPTPAVTAEAETPAAVDVEAHAAAAKAEEAPTAAKAEEAPTAAKAEQAPAAAVGVDEKALVSTEEEDVIVVESESLERTKTLKQLRDMCVDRGLPSNGKKSDLIERLVSSS